MVFGTARGPEAVVRTADAVTGLARAQAALLPAGGTSAYRAPSGGEAIASATAFTTVGCLVLLGSSVVASRRVRRRTAAPAGTRLPGSVDVSQRATTIRRRGLVLALVQVAAVNLVVIGVLGALEGIDALDVAVAVGGALVGILGTQALGRRDRAPAAHGGASRRGRDAPAGLAGVTIGIVALALLVSGTAVTAMGLRDLAFRPSLTALERSATLRVSPTALAGGTSAIGVGLLAVGGFAFRAARRRARASAARLRASDGRRPILYLRSFDDDDLPLASVVSARRPFLEFFRVRGGDPFEEAIAWQLAPHGPVVAVGRPGRPLASLGAARDLLAEGDWRSGVTERMREAQAVVLVIGTTEGLAWEVAQLVDDGQLAKTVFLLPPTDPAALQRRLSHCDETLRAKGVAGFFAVGATAGALAVVQVDGGWQALVADVRDEASYRAAVDQSVGMARALGEHHALPVG
jgi:hypothetical protein